MVKEIVVEILTEGLGDVSQLSEGRSVAPRKQEMTKPRTAPIDRKRQFDPKLDTPVRSAPKVDTGAVMAARATSDPILQSILADTASTTLVEQFNADKSPMTALPAPKTDIPIEALEQFVGTETSKWADIAFADKPRPGSHRISAEG